MLIYISTLKWRWLKGTAGQHQCGEKYTRFMGELFLCYSKFPFSLLAESCFNTTDCFIISLYFFICKECVKFVFNCQWNFQRLKCHVQFLFACLSWIRFDGCVQNHFAVTENLIYCCPSLQQGLKAAVIKDICS